MPSVCPPLCAGVSLLRARVAHPVRSLRCAVCVLANSHGWQLGELNEWSKKTNTELATHIPMIIRVP